MTLRRVRFPAEDLRARGGSIHALLFENPSAGVPLGVTWHLDVQFEPVRFGPPGEEQRFDDCSATWEWIRFPIGDWRALEGRAIEARGDPDASFYVIEHDPTRRSRLEILGREGNSFLTRWDLVVDFHGYFGPDRDPRMRIRFEVRLAFQGLMIHSGLVPPAPETASAARAAVHGFHDPGAYGPPEVRTNRFGVSAWWFPPCAPGGAAT